jgi:indole-3-glycerol phosphate synthase
MKGTFLETIVSTTRERVARVKTDQYLNALRKKAEKKRQGTERRRFRDALAAANGANIIAEIKRASPSKGAINLNINVAAQAARYEAGGAAAISVLTEPDHFQGTMADLLSVRQAVDVPVLRKDFILDEFQILEAAAAGADAVLLIAAALGVDELTALRRFTEDEVGIDALVEVHDLAELNSAIEAGARLIGVNNRNLHSLEVSLDTSRELAVHKPSGAVFVAESGLTSRTEIDELKTLGFDAFLIGEALMKSADPVAALEELGA